MLSKRIAATMSMTTRMASNSENRVSVMPPWSAQRLVSCHHAFEAQHNATVRATIYQQLLDAIVAHRVAERPDRIEPRLRKRDRSTKAEARNPTRYAKRPYK